MEKKGYTKAAIVITSDDVNDYFLAIDLETGLEIGRRSTEDFETWRYDDCYDEESMTRKVALALNLTQYTVIHW